MFDAAAQETLGHYVYALFEPGARKPFYIGKGKGNRVFCHAVGEISPQEAASDAVSPKLHLIHQIKARGDVVVQKICRSGLTEDEAFLVEASLIDMVNYISPDTLLNEVSGHGTADGFADAIDLASELCAKPLKSDMPLLLIKIEKKWKRLIENYGPAHAVPPSEIYKSVRGDWKISRTKATKAHAVLAVARGIVRAAYVDVVWSESNEPSRRKFKAVSASAPISDFVGCSVAGLFQKGEANPIRYLNC